jgi:multiple sugar transport system permease protein
MPIIPAIGRRSTKIRALIAFVYGVLILGSCTTVFPFMMMVSTASTSITDMELYHVPPKYTYNDQVLTAKYLQEKYKRELFDNMKLRYRFEEPFTQVMGDQTVERKYGRTLDMLAVFPTFELSDASLQKRLADWVEFKKMLPMKYKDTFFHSGTFPVGGVEVAFQNYLRGKYPTTEDLRAGLLQPSLNSHVDIGLPYDAYERHSWQPDDSIKMTEWLECRKTLPDRMIMVMTVKPLYQKYLIDAYGKIAVLNEAWGTEYKYFWEVPFPFTRPSGASAKDWETFVRKSIPLQYVRLDVAVCGPSFTKFLEERFRTVEVYNGKLEDNAASLETVALSEYMPAQGLKCQNWTDYYENVAPIEGIVIDSADVHYADSLKAKYGDVAALNAAYGAQFPSFEDAAPPYREEDYNDLMTNRGRIIREFLVRNYTYVIKRIFLMGRPIFNTFILVTLVVFTQVTINPLAAYALSRYRLSYTAKVLIFMLATMAFPAEVAMIPNFLMIKQLHLLNTYAALILPGLASGYYVFLLKGFFDSLPQELYESASIDGATELRMFATITLPLSLPVLSVIALYAFGGSYGSFLWAFTVCQDQKMWTLMVFLQQFQMQAAGGANFVVMAALVIAAIPTAIVFLSAQKVLMKGIVVPTMR